MITAIGDVAAPFLAIVIVFALIVAVGALFRSSDVEPSPVRSPYHLPGGVERRGSVGCRAKAISTVGKRSWVPPDEVARHPLSHVKKHEQVYDWDAEGWA